MKGQIYIAFAILILLLLSGITIFISNPPERSNGQLFNAFADLKKEIIETADLSLANGESATQNLNNFLAYSDGILSARGYDQEHSVSQNGNIIEVSLALKFEGSYLSDTIIIDRTVFA